MRDIDPLVRSEDYCGNTARLCVGFYLVQVKVVMVLDADAQNLVVASQTDLRAQRRLAYITVCIRECLCISLLVANFEILVTCWRLLVGLMSRFTSVAMSIGMLRNDEGSGAALEEAEVPTV